MSREPDYLIESGGGSLFSPNLDPEAFAAFVELIRTEMAKGSYQMAPDELPYEGSAARVAQAAYLAGIAKDAS